MPKPVVIYGSRTLARMIFYDASHQADFCIAGFAVDEPYLSADGLFLGLPQVAVAALPDRWPSDCFDLLALHAGSDSLRERSRFFERAAALGYDLRNYVSPGCDLAPDVRMGRNNVILAQSHIGLSGVMGDNNLIRQQVYLGHDFRLGDHNILTPGCRIGGFCTIGSGCYFGLGCVVLNRLTIADETLVGAGSVVLQPSEPHARVVGNPGRVTGYHADEGICLRYG